MNDGVYEARDTYESRMADAVSMLAVENDGSDSSSLIDVKQSINVCVCIVCCYLQYEIFSYYLMYRTLDMDADKNKGGVFRPKYLDFIEASTNAVFNTPGLESYCWKPYGPTGACFDPISPVERFRDNDTGVYVDVVDMLKNLSRPENLEGGSMPFGFFVDRKFSQSYPYSEYTRTAIMTGYPLNGYTYGGRGEIDDDESFLEQREKQDKFFMDEILPVLEKWRAKADDVGIELVYFSMAWFIARIMEAAMTYVMMVMTS